MRPRRGGGAQRRRTERGGDRWGVGGMDLRSQKRATEEDEWAGKEVKRIQRQMMSDLFMAGGEHRTHIGYPQVLSFFAG
jgi:hypothetical protein